MQHMQAVNFIHLSSTIISIGNSIFGLVALQNELGHGHRAVCRPVPWSVYHSQHSIQSHDTWSMWLMAVCWARSVSSHELQHSRNRNCECRRVKSLTLAIAITTGFTWLIKFLGDKLLYGHVPDSFPRCGIGSGHVRLSGSWGSYILVFTALK